MQDSKKPSVSLWVGLLAIGLTFLSVYASAEDDDIPSVKLTEKEKNIFQQVLNPSGGDSATRCKDTVAMVKEQGDSRTEENLMSTCLSLPSDHEHICGIPTEPSAYSTTINDRCYTLEAGIQQHAHARKVETRELSASFYNDEPVTGSGDGDGEETGTVRGAQ